MTAHLSDPVLEAAAQILRSSKLGITVRRETPEQVADE